MKWGWLLSAAALAGFLIVRRRRLRRWLLAAGVLAVVGLGLVGIGVIRLPNLEHLLLDLGRVLGRWTYLLVGVLAFLETGAFVGLVAPGETTVIVGGVVAGQGEISLVVLIGIVWTCAVAGDLTSYALGRRLGREWLLRHGERVRITEERLRQVEGFFARRGGVTILVGRFIGLVRALAPFVAGTARMPLRTFLPYDVLGAGLWSVTFCVLGYVFWHSFGQLTTYVSRGLLAFGTVVAIGGALVVLVQLRRDAAKRERVEQWLRQHEHRRWVGPLVRLARPLWRWALRPAAAGIDAGALFAWRRLTPGGLGLEVTTMLALIAVAVFGFVLLGQVVLEPGTPEIDRLASDAVDQLTMAWLTDVVKVVTDLGSLPVAAFAALVTAAWALRQRSWFTATALVAGLALSYAAVHMAKAAYDRPRPSGGLVDAALSSYPSGHSAYAVTLLACAIAFARTGAGWWTLRFAALTVAAIAVAAVGLSRVYLRVHFLTDALGGIALGAAIWSTCGILALVAGHVRHNGDPGP